MPAYGLGGPWRDRTGFAQTMESITGMAWVTGWADGPPVLPRGPCDPLASAHAVFATILALAERDRTGVGRLVEATMIEAALNAAAEVVVEYGASGTELTRNGNRGPVRRSAERLPVRGRRAVDRDRRRNRRAVGRAAAPRWAIPSGRANPDFANASGRRATQDAIDAHIAAWSADQDAADLAERLAAAGVPAGVVVDARDIARQPAAPAPQLLRDGAPPDQRRGPAPGGRVEVRRQPRRRGCAAPRRPSASTTTRCSASCSG